MTNENTRLKAVNRILGYARDAEHGSKSPAIFPAAFGAGAGAGIGFGIGRLIEISGFFAGFPASGFILIIGLIAGGITGYRLAKYKSWEECIFDQLANYQPIDETAFCNLKMKAAEKSLEFDDIIAWALIERSRIVPTAGDLARERFVRK